MENIGFVTKWMVWQKTTVMKIVIERPSLNLPCDDNMDNRHKMWQPFVMVIFCRHILLSFNDNRKCHILVDQIVIQYVNRHKLYVGNMTYSTSAVPCQHGDVESDMAQLALLFNI
jgi:nicotinic acid mononucleotide adenylyltransferase